MNTLPDEIQVHQFVKYQHTKKIITPYNDNSLLRYDYAKL